jgi:hypothetical protein
LDIYLSKFSYKLSTIETLPIEGCEVITVKVGNLWNVYLNGFLVYENFKSASSQEPESAYYVASDLSWVAGSTNPATSLVSFT